MQIIYKISEEMLRYKCLAFLFKLQILKKMFIYNILNLRTGFQFNGHFIVKCRWVHEKFYIIAEY